MAHRKTEEAAEMAHTAKDVAMVKEAAVAADKGAAAAAAGGDQINAEHSTTAPN